MGSGIAQELAREGGDGRGHGRREEEGLPLLREPAEDAADVGEEAHVEHAVGLVEHQHLEAVEADIGMLHVVEEPAGRGDDDVHATAEGGLLRAHADAAEHRGALDGREAGEIAEIGLDLRGQLARGRDHERARGAARLVHQALR